MLTTVKNSVTTIFLLGELSNPTNGKITIVEASEITKPTAVFVEASINDCFLVCIVWRWFFVFFNL